MCYLRDMRVERYTSALLENTGFPVHGFTKRSGGTSEGPFASLNLAYGVGDNEVSVAENRMRLRGALGTGSPLATVIQVHGNKVVNARNVATEDWTASPTEEADGIISSGAEVLAVQTADCAPVLLADPASRIVAALHAGWRSAARGIIRNGIRAMESLGAETRNLLAVIGPCISGACYEVGEEVARALPESADPVRRRPGKYLLDLPNAVEVSLIVAGVPSAQVEVIRACTHCLPDELFSYRRDGQRTGRMLGFISAE